MASPSAHTQAPLSLEQSRSVSDLRKTSQSSSSSAALASSTSSSPSPFLLTLRIVRLVNTFRKRAKTRVHARHPKKETSAKVRRDFCQAFERQAFDEIDRYLGRKTAHPLRKGRKDGGYGSPLLERTALDSDLTAVKGPKARKPNIEWYVTLVLSFKLLSSSASWHSLRCLSIAHSAKEGRNNRTSTG